MPWRSSLTKAGIIHRTWLILLKEEMNIKMLAPYKIKHHVMQRIPDTAFEAVRNGMQAVMEYGTAVRSRISDIIICGKTGTVENYDKGKKQPDHSFFGGFAPRDNPESPLP
jgi:penicillin-binding protein 2